MHLLQNNYTISKLTKWSYIIFCGICFISALHLLANYMNCMNTDLCFINDYTLDAAFLCSEINILDWRSRYLFNFAGNVNIKY